MCLLLQGMTQGKVLQYSTHSMAMMGSSPVRVKGARERLPAQTKRGFQKVHLLGSFLLFLGRLGRADGTAVPNSGKEKLTFCFEGHGGGGCLPTLMRTSESILSPSTRELSTVPNLHWPIRKDLHSVGKEWGPWRPVSSTCAGLDHSGPGRSSRLFQQDPGPE